MQQQSSFLNKLQCILEVVLQFFIRIRTIFTFYVGQTTNSLLQKTKVPLSLKFFLNILGIEKTRIISHYAFKRSYIMWDEFKFTKPLKTTLKQLEEEFAEQKKQIKNLQEQQFQLIKQINLEVNRCIALQIIMAEFTKQQIKFFTDGRQACYPVVTFFVKLSRGFKEKTGYLNFLYKEFVPQKYQLFPWTEGEKIPGDLYDQSFDHFSPLQFQFE
ncbi:hypothetical protein pb186bvf_009912 [Paramecium bursaria]